MKIKNILIILSFIIILTTLCCRSESYLIEHNNLAIYRCDNKHLYIYTVVCENMGTHQIAASYYTEEDYGDNYYVYYFYNKIRERVGYFRGECYINYKELIE